MTVLFKPPAKLRLLEHLAACQNGHRLLQVVLAYPEYLIDQLEMRLMDWISVSFRAGGQQYK